MCGNLVGIIVTVIGHEKCAYDVHNSKESKSAINKNRVYDPCMEHLNQNQWATKLKLLCITWSNNNNYYEWMNRCD